MPKVKATRTIRTRRSHAPDKRRSATAHRFGAHTSIAGGMHHALEIGLRLGCDTVQVFVKNQRQWRAAPLRADDLRCWNALLDTPGFGPVIAHATYLINLASADKIIRTRSLAAFEQELQRCQTLHIPYLVVHPGAATDGDRRSAIVAVAAALDDLAKRGSRRRSRHCSKTPPGRNGPRLAARRAGRDHRASATVAGRRLLGHLPPLCRRLRHSPAAGISGNGRVGRALVRARTHSLLAS